MGQAEERNDPPPNPSEQANVSPPNYSLLLRSFIQLCIFSHPSFDYRSNTSWVLFDLLLEFYNSLIRSSSAIQSPRLI